MEQEKTKVIFGGRLGEYKYYDMDAVVRAALDRCEKERNSKGMRYYEL
ncbi:MAG: hypothetical protein ACI4HI_18745 [Lachnospiraceae bacterium]